MARPALFLTCAAPEPGVFESQALEVGELMRQLRISYRYLVFEGLRAAVSSRHEIRQRIDNLRKSYGCEMSLKFVPRPTSRLGIAFSAHLVAAGAPTGRFEPLLLHARGPVAARIAVAARQRLPGARVLFDARGDSAAEARLNAELEPTRSAKRRWISRARRLEEIERLVTAEADHILAVSEALRDHLMTLAGVASTKTTVIPCCIDPQRFPSASLTRREMRERLGLANRLVFVFSGSLGTYQVPDRVATLFEAIHAHRPASHLLVLTKDLALAQKVFGRLESDGDCTIRSSPYRDVGAFLSAGDVGLLLREPNAVNHVASPVKFAEYQAAGLPVVVTRGLGDVSRLVEATGYGAIVDWKNSVETQAMQVIRAFDNGDWPRLRDQIRETALTRFSRVNYREQYREVLLRLGILQS